MSNLGLYQKVTTWSKKMGGPLNFLIVVAAGGYVAGRTIETGGKILLKSIKRHIGNRKDADTEVYAVHTEGSSDEGLKFSINDKFRVLEIVDDAVLIEKIGDTNNPYFVSVDLLYSISNFNHLRRKGK